MLQFLLNCRYVLGLLPLSCGGHRFQPQFCDHILHSNVTGQVPVRAIQLGIHVHVPEHTVHHDMQIIPHRDFFCSLVIFQNVSGIVQNVLAVRQQSGFFDGEEFKLTQRRIQKPQIHQQCIPGQGQHIFGQLIQFFCFFRHGSTFLKFLIPPRRGCCFLLRKFRHNCLPFHRLKHGHSRRTQRVRYQLHCPELLR